jgi:hypothetical protein
MSAAVTSAFGYASRSWANPPDRFGWPSYANLGKQRMRQAATHGDFRDLSRQ